MNDIIPPKKSPTPPMSARGGSRPISPTSKPVVPPQPIVSTARFDLPEGISTELEPSKAPKKKRPILRWFIAIGVLIIVVVAAIGWYVVQQRPVDVTSTASVRLVIESGIGPKAIAAKLKQEQLIRSTLGFDLYTRFDGSADQLQAGSYVLSKNMSLAEIVDHLQNGKAETFKITFYPGATLRDTTSKPDSKKTDVFTVLKRAGYSESEITAALAKKYTHPVFATKPDSADLEGYVYGETYEFASEVTVEQILTKTFDQLYDVIQQNNLVVKFKAEGFTLYQGITFASIIQREVNGEKDQKEISAVFYNRYKQGMNLGSDVTYQYIADKTGQVRSPDLDSPYNTRKYTGLPPGPIAAPGKTTLLAAAEPAKNDYIFFLSGDDDVTYFATTQAGHEANIKNHCQQKCQIL